MTPKFCAITGGIKTMTLDPQLAYYLPQNREAFLPFPALYINGRYIEDIRLKSR
jgi:hypothetical protein